MAYLISYNYLYIDKLAWSIEALNIFMCIYLVRIKWARSLVALIPYNLTVHQRHSKWLFSSFSMWSSSQMYERELRTSIFPECDNFPLKSGGCGSTRDVLPVRELVGGLFQLPMGFSFPFLSANDLRLSLLIIRLHIFLLSCTYRVHTQS